MADLPSTPDDGAFARPDGVATPEGFNPPPGQRLAPMAPPRPAVPWMFADAFSAPAAARDGFDAPPGARISPQARPVESPWWKRDAATDPWRNPSAPSWLGRGAIFAAGRPNQLLPEEDQEFDESEFALADEDDTNTPAGSGARTKLGLRLVLLGVVIALIAGGIGGGTGYFLAHQTSSALHIPNVHLSQTGRPANRPPGSVADIAKRIGPAVVSIAVNTDTISAVGSGVVIDSRGYVLTNNHVVSPAATGGSIVVTFSNENTAKATIVGRDPVSDLAVLKVPDASLTVASLGKSADLAVGDPVVAIGSPLGLQGTVTSGIVSALNRPVHVFDDSGNSDAYIGAIQTDAAINPGNSGGALVDANGLVVGINSATAQLSASSQATGIGFAIPIDYAKTVAEQLIASGKAVHGVLGANGRSVIAGLTEGAYLEQVLPGGPAAKAGLSNGDVIVVADGQPILSYDRLVVIVQEHNPGDKIVVSYLRGSAKRSTTVTLGKG